MRKTKIIATIGPASQIPEVFEKMVDAGLNVARLNMSHGSYEEHKGKIDLIKRTNDKLGTNIAIMLDTKGPEIRLGDFSEDTILLIEGNTFTLTTKEIIGNEQISYVTYKKIVKDVKKGTKILLNDGLVMLRVEKVKKDSVECIVENTGIIKSKKSVNIPGLKLSLDFMNDKDREDIKFGVDNDIDYIAASFVRRKEDIAELREYVDSIGGENIKIIAKIENQEGVENIEEILEIADGLMVARGDMGVEVAIQELPIIQKSMIKKCIAEGKIVITATQMLESMVNNPRPTRAEVSDVANAIYDGTSCIMLSAESATGKYPVECIEMMGKIAEETERNIDYWNRFKKRNVEKLGAYVEGKQEKVKTKAQDIFRKQINFSVCSSAMFTEAKAIICISDFGKTPAVLSGYRPNCPIYVVTSNIKTYMQLAMQWGIQAVFVEDENDFDNLLNSGIDILIREKAIKKGDIVILSGGTSKESEAGNYLSSQTMGAVIRI
ncbi:MAG: pyruvate kinase [Clostridia bacterium]|nr:pyruvate kinase [Clostridia bacterium]